MFIKFRIIDDEYIVKKLKGIVKLVSEVIPFGFLKFDIKSFSLQYKSKSVASETQFAPIGIPYVYSL